MVEIDAVDRQSATLDIAKRLSENYPEISFIPADILEWHPAARYGVVLCSLVLHHFSEDDAVRVLRRCRELSKRFVLVSDLRRGLLASVGVYLLTALIFRKPMTRYDGRAFGRTRLLVPGIPFARRTCGLERFRSQEISLRAPSDLARKDRQLTFRIADENSDNCRNCSGTVAGRKAPRPRSDDGRVAQSAWRVDPRRARAGRARWAKSSSASL